MKKKSAQNNLLPFAAIALFLVISVGFLIYNQNSLALNKSQTDLSVPSGWQVYLNNINNFSIQYPTSWKVVASNQYLLSLVSDKNEAISVSTDLNQKKLDLKTWLTKNYPLRYTRSFKTVTISKLEARKSDTERVVYIQMADKKIVAISYKECLGVKCGPGKIDAGTFNTIVSSFKSLR